MELWEGTDWRSINPKTQGLTIKYGEEDVTNKVTPQGWDPRITDGSTKQTKEFVVEYGGRTVIIKVTFYQALAVEVKPSSAVDGHPVAVTVNHPDRAENSFSTDYSDYNFRFIPQSNEQREKKLFEDLCKRGGIAPPQQGNYVVANTSTCGTKPIDGTASATMTVGKDDTNYKATRTASAKAEWHPFSVTYFNQTAHNAYVNRGNYSDPETGTIAGARDENAGTSSLIAAGDVVTYTCNTPATVKYKGDSLLEQWLNVIFKDGLYVKPDEKDYTVDTDNITKVTLKYA